MEYSQGLSAKRATPGKEIVLPPRTPQACEKLAVNVDRGYHRYALSTPG
jgi:hypothetical protein